MFKTIIWMITLMFILLLAGFGCTEADTLREEDVEEEIEEVVEWLPEDFIYFYSGRREEGIYKRNIHTSEESKIVAGSEIYIIAIVDDWLFFYTSEHDFDLVDGGRILKGITMTINRIRTNGTELTLIAELEDGCDIAIADGWLFYCTKTFDPSKDAESALFKMRIDGTDSTKLNDDVSSFAIVNNWIYYTTRSFPTSLYKARIDGTDQTLIYRDDVVYFIVEGDWIYYSGYPRSGQINDNGVHWIYIKGTTISKVRTDGSGHETIVDGILPAFFLEEGWLYYVNFDDDERLYRISVDGNGKEMIRDDRNTYLNTVRDGWIYYWRRTDDHVGSPRSYNDWCKIRIDGTEWQQMDPEEFFKVANAKMVN